MQFCVTRVILRDLAALVPQIFHSLHKITHFLTGYINTIVGNYNKTHTKQGVTHLHKKVWRWMRKLHLHLKNSLSLKPNIIIMIQVQHSWTYIRLKTIIITDNLIFRLPHRH
jgi:hypothetical protein